MIAVKDILPQATTSRTATCDEGTLCRVRILSWGAGKVGRGNMHAGALTSNSEFRNIKSVLSSMIRRGELGSFSGLTRRLPWE